MLDFFGVICLSIVFITGCNSADDGNNTIPDESTNTLEELTTDSEFVGLLEGIITVHDNSSNLSSIQELLNKDIELTDSELLQIANALGFDSMESYEKFEDEFWVSWIDIIERFDLFLEDKDTVAKIFTDGLIQVKDDMASKGPTDNGKKLNECADGDTPCICRVNFSKCAEPFSDVAIGFDRFCERDENGEVFCDPEAAKPKGGLTLVNILVCLEDYDCCLIGWDSEECAAIFPCC